MLWLAALLLLLPPDTQPSAWPIEKLTVEGNRNYSTQQILAVGGLKPGQVAGKAEFEAARDRLLAAGVFESVGYKFEPARNSKGYAASFQVVEIGPLFPMRFDDLGAAPDEIRAWLQRTEPLYAAKIPGTPALLDHYAKAIEKFLETKGLKKQVAGTLNGDNPSEVFAVFRPAGRLPVIAEVRFIGNAVVPAFALQNAVASSAVGLPYNEARFRLTLDSTIRPLYEKRGRIRVSFPDIQVEPAKNVTGLTITVSIKEGESYQLGKVKVEGTGISPEALLKTGAFKTGDPADFDQVQEGLDRIRTKLGSTGYLHPVINVEREVNDQSKSVDLTIHIEPGAQYLFGKLRVEGLDLNGEAEIARLWALKEGTPFKADYPDYFLERVKEGAVFENLKQTKAIQKADDKAHTVDVTLVFK